MDNSQIRQVNVHLVRYTSNRWQQLNTRLILAYLTLSWAWWINDSAIYQDSKVHKQLSVVKCRQKQVMLNSKNLIYQWRKLLHWWKQIGFHSDLFRLFIYWKLNQTFSQIKYFRWATRRTSKLNHYFCWVRKVPRRETRKRNRWSIFTVSDSMQFVFGTRLAYLSASAWLHWQKKVSLFSNFIFE